MGPDLQLGSEICAQMWLALGWGLAPFSPSCLCVRTTESTVTGTLLRLRPAWRGTVEGRDDSHHTQSHADPGHTTGSCSCQTNLSFAFGTLSSALWHLSDIYGNLFSAVPKSLTLSLRRIPLFHRCHFNRFVQPAFDLTSPFLAFV